VDKHIYARENGWFIEALTTLYAVTGDSVYRDEAVRAAEWISQHRAISDGGFRHGDEQSGPISLGDTLAMGRAFLGLYVVTGDHAWLDRADRAAGFIHDHFAYHAQDAAIGFATATGVADPAHFAPVPDFDENVSLARFANLLFHYTGDKRDRTMAETALRFAGAPEVAKSRLSSVGGLLLAEHELATDPLHIAIVGKAGDASAQTLFKTALAFPYVYKQVEWIDPGAKDSTPDASIYPELPQAAAYTCVNRACSAPVFDEAHLIALLERKTAAK
jgi:uncharacterized protein